MIRSNQTNSVTFAVSFYAIMLIGVSLVAILAAFVLANSYEDYETKSMSFSAIIVVYLLICLVVYYWNSKNSVSQGMSDKKPRGDVNIDKKLLAIEEASEYFGGSLKSADMFRLVSNKVNEILPFKTSVLYLIDRPSGNMRIVRAQGENAESFQSVKTDLESGVTGRCYITEMVQIDRDLLACKDSIQAKAMAGFRSSAAIPLMKSSEVFAILQLYSDSRTAFDGNSITILEAVGERVTPLILGSLSFERSLSNALTDPVTELPNERAFHLILENQVAEAQRNRGLRHLTVVAIDIKRFDELNLKYGHASGDRILSLIAHAIKGELRQMDFLARAANDEFLAILPTANEDVAEDVIGRIRTGLFTTRFLVSDTDAIQPELNFGVAEFGIHGETADPLILTARLRKQQAKADASKQVLWFPKDLVN